MFYNLTLTDSGKPLNRKCGLGSKKMYYIKEMTAAFNSLKLSFLLENPTEKKQTKITLNFYSSV
jgi:hypothetical protein